MRLSDATLLAGAALDLASLALYVHAGRLVRRALPRDAGRAVDGFALFWYGVGAVNGLQAALSLVAVFQEPSLALALAVWNTRIVLALVAFGGLAYYLLYVYTGRAWLRGAIAAYYALTFLVMQWWILAEEPVGVRILGWRVDIASARDVGLPLYPTAVLMFFLPTLVAALMYARLVGVAREPAQRRRVALVSASFLVYFAGLLLGYTNLAWPWWGLVENLLGIGAGVGVIAALLPEARARAEGRRA